MIIKNKKEMGALAAKIAGEILSAKISARKGAMILALTGDLGAGKTTFAQGLAGALGIKSRITSPTFLIIRRYNIPRAKSRGYINFHHIDAYRLNSPKELLDLGFADLLKDPKNIILIEWADKIKNILPEGTSWMAFSHGDKEGERIVDLFDHK